MYQGSTRGDNTQRMQKISALIQVGLTPKQYSAVEGVDGIQLFGTTVQRLLGLEFAYSPKLPSTVLRQPGFGPSLLAKGFRVLGFRVLGLTGFRV